MLMYLIICTRTDDLQIAKTAENAYIESYIIFLNIGGVVKCANRKLSACTYNYTILYI